MKVVEKTLTCSSRYDGYKGFEEIEHIVADDLDKGWYITSISKFVRPSKLGLEPELIAIITLRRREFI